MSGEPVRMSPVPAEPGLRQGSSFGRQRLASRRVAAARAALADCRFCAHDCRVDRLAGARGVCAAGPDARVFSAQVEVSDELAFIPTYALAFSGCDLRCSFCITGAQSWHPASGGGFDAAQFAGRARAALANGARSIMILGGEPTIHLPSVLELVSALPEDALLIWKTNAHGSSQAREFLAGLFDVWLVDYKFGNDACARRLAKVANYAAVVRANLSWAALHSELVIRHLLMPGHLECCWRPVAQWIHDWLPEVKVNLRAGFWPAWQASRHGELTQPAGAAEIKEAWAIAGALGLNLIE